MKVLLVFPPFTPGHAPHPGIACLAAHLRAHGHEVSALDAGVEYYHWLLVPERIEEGRRAASRRLLALNGQPSLTGSEIHEYGDLASILQAGRRVVGSLHPVMSPERAEAYAGERGDRFYTAAALATHGQPEHIVRSRATRISVRSPHSPYSSRDIVAASQDMGAFEGFLEPLLARVLRERRPRVVGLSVAFPQQIVGALRCARALKRLDPGLYVVMGGSYVTACLAGEIPAALFEHVDGLVVGPGEIPLLRLVEALAGDEPDMGHVPALRRLVDGRVVSTAPPPPPDLETLPPPRFDIHDLDRYVTPRRETLYSVRTSHGCYWARCAFCRTGLSIVRDFSQSTLDHVHSHIVDVTGQTGMPGVTLSDECVPVPFLERLADALLARGPAIRWITNVRFDAHLTLECCTRLRQSGCVGINLGLETYNDRLLGLVHKGITTRLVDTVLSNLAWAGIPVLVYMMVGLPTETEEEAMRTYEAVRRFRCQGLIARFQYNPFQLLSHSPIAADPSRFGLRDVRPREGHDLHGTLTYETSGIASTRATLMARHFNRHDDAPPAREVPVEGGLMTLRHDLDDVARAALEGWPRLDSR